MTTYYTYNSTTKRLSPLHPPLRVDGHTVIHPTTAQFAAFGAYPRGADATPTPPEGKVAVPDGYELSSGAWVRTWSYEDAPPAPDVVVQSDGVYHLVDASTGEYARVDVVYDAEQDALVQSVVRGLVKRSDGTIGEEEEEDDSDDS